MTIFVGDLAGFLIDHVGVAAVIVGSLLGFAVLVWVATRLDG